MNTQQTLRQTDDQPDTKDVVLQCLYADFTYLHLNTAFERMNKNKLQPRGFIAVAESTMNIASHMQTDSPWEQPKNVSKQTESGK